MYVAARSLERRAYDALVTAGAADVTPTQARLMAQIDPDGTRVVSLAARARITKQSAAFLVDQLERAGYVVRVADPHDGRIPAGTTLALGSVAGGFVLHEIMAAMGLDYLEACPVRGVRWAVTG